MSGNAIQGPLVVHAEDPLGIVANLNPDQAPSPFLMGTGMLDPRPNYTYAPGNASGTPTLMWVMNDFMVIHAIPSAISAVNIAAVQTPGAAALTLVSVTGAGITAGVTLVRGDNKATVTGLLAVDGPMVPVTYGQIALTNTFQAWNPYTSLARALRFTSAGNDSAITFNIRGYDLYGFPLSENVTGANAGVATGKKAWKYITSITPSAAVATTVSVGTADIFELPLRADAFAHTDIVWNNASVTANTGFVVPDATTPATVLTGGTRGTYATQSASDGTKQLTVYIKIPAANIGTTVGILGVTNV